MTDDARFPSSAPPTSRAKRRNAVLALYDSPVHRDWAFWMTMGWGAITGAAIGSSDQPRSMPVWLDTLLAVLTFVTLFGVFPAWLRLLVRRWLSRRHHGSPRPAVGTPLPPPVQYAPAPAMPAAARPSPPVQAPPPPPPAPPSHPRPAPVAGTTSPSSSPDVLAAARNTMPHPVARAVRTFQLAHTGKDQYEALLDAAEILAICVSVTSAALLRGTDGTGHGVGLRNLSALRSAFLSGGGATFGTWTNWLDALRRLAADRPDVVPGLRESLHDEPDSPGLVGRLNALRAERNRAAHGDRPQSVDESALRVAECVPHLEKALEQAEFLTRTPWLLTVSCAYRPRSHTFDVVAHHVMGDHPDFERREFTWTQPVADGMFYVLSPDGPVSLSPFVASLFCPQCRQMEVCYASKAVRDSGPATLKSFARGHDVLSDDLGDEIRALPDHRRGTGN
ncbi:hypothetical protein [Streptomyces blattellae]|uniref:hypothetical protein n=1 Tax=Streptomyces blattellae TaxID=2569855 RepID=UPI0012B90ED1|nr:hypothetical protein [Streptomyces blattellae]